jgi:hypothetical protein
VRVHDRPLVRETQACRKRPNVRGVAPLGKSDKLLAVRPPLPCSNSEDPHPETEEHRDKKGSDHHNLRAVQPVESLRQGARRKPVNQARAG